MRKIVFILATIIVAGCSSAPMTQEASDRIEQRRRDREKALCEMSGGCTTYNPRVPNRSNRF